MAMIIDEQARKLAGWQHRLGRDRPLPFRSSTARGVALYSQFEVQRGLPVSMLLRYFRRAKAKLWQVNEHLRAKVSFKTQNLMLRASATWVRSTSCSAATC